MEIKKIVTEQMDQNCYLVSDGKKGILIDPGIDTFKILKETEGYEINYIFLTHCHFDHLQSLNELRRGRICVGSKNCGSNMISPKISLLTSQYNITAPCEKIMEDGEEKIFDGIKVKCIYTPGHTSCSACYLIENRLFSGDTLFLGSVGRCDLPTGSLYQLEKSLKTKIYTLDDATEVYPGHGPATTVGYEKKHNGYITE